MLLLTRGLADSFRKRRRYFRPISPRKGMGSLGGMGSIIGRESNAFGFENSIVLRSMTMEEDSVNDLQPDQAELVQLESG